jgi:hypothetical protein
MDLNATKPQFRELAPLIGLAFLALIPAIIGGALIIAAWPRREGAGVSGWQALAIGAGALLCYGGGSFFMTLRKALTHGIMSFYGRVDDWHEAQLAKFQEGDGRHVATQVTEWHLTTTDARHMLLLLLYVYLSGKAPSIRSLTEGPLLVRAGHRAFSLGVVSQDSAADALNLLAQSGVLVDRGQRQQGKLAVMDFKNAAQRVLAELGRDPRVLDAEAIE